MTKYYTGRGDDGTTGILSGRRVGKSDALIEAIGDLDELNSAVGVALLGIKDQTVEVELKAIQNDLFVLGANLAYANESKSEKAQIKPKALQRLESSIKNLDEKTPDLKRFVLPGGSACAANLHLARAIARRAERRVIAAGKEYKIERGVVAYLNRLSSYLFAAAIYVNMRAKVDERHPKY